MYSPKQMFASKWCYSWCWDSSYTYTAPKTRDFITSGPILELPKATGTPQLLHCFLQCTLSVKDDKICSIAATVHSLLNGSACRVHESMHSHVTSYFWVLSYGQLDKARLPESRVEMLHLLVSQTVLKGSTRASSQILSYI